MGIHFFMYYGSFKGSSFKHMNDKKLCASDLTQDVTPVYAQTYSTLHPKYTAKQKRGMHPTGLHIRCLSMNALYRKKEGTGGECRPPAKKETLPAQSPIVCSLYQRLKAHLEGGLGSDPFHWFSQESNLNSAFHTRATALRFVNSVTGTPLRYTHSSECHTP